MVAFGVAQPQGSGDRVENLVGHADDVTLLQPDVPIRAHSGEHSDFFAA